MTDMIANLMALPVTRPIVEIEFRTKNGIAHATPIGFNTALCGMETTGPAPTQAVPCSRCLTLAAAKIAAAS